MKTCTKCKETKAFSEFHKNKGSKDGLHPHCKQCKGEANAAYRATNSDKERERQRKYRASNSDKQRESVRKWHAANPEYSRDYYKTNRDKRLESVRKYRATNPDKIRETNRKYYEANRDKKRESVRKWKIENPERVKSYEHAYRARKVDLYGNEPDHARIAEWMQLTKDDACRWCGTRDFSEGVHWDHVVPLSIGGPHEFWNVVKTCAACNLRKNARLPQEVGFV